MKIHIISCLALCAFITYCLWPIGNPVSELIPVVEKEAPQIEHALKPPATIPKVIFAHDFPPTQATESEAELEPTKPNDDEEERRFAESQERIHVSFNEFADLVEDFDARPPSANDEERELRDVAISSAARRLADLMIESGTKQIRYRGWNFFVSPDGSYDFGKNPDGYEDEPHRHAYQGQG